MTVTDRDVSILRALRRYYYLRARQIGSLVAPNDKDGGIVRSRMRALEKEQLARRCEKSILDHLDPQTAAPAWILTLKGSATLARVTQDASLLFQCEPTFRDFSSIGHYCRLSALHILIDLAIAAQVRVKLSGLTFEHEVVEPCASDPAKKFKLYTQVSAEPKIPCIPDSAFVLEVEGRRRAYFVEYETGSDSPGRVCALKHKGYALLHSTRKYLDIFPEVSDFRVLCCCPYASWRETLRTQMKDKPGAGLWLFVTTPEITAENFLHGELVFKVETARPLPLIPSIAAPVTPSPAGEAGGRVAGEVREEVTT